MIHRVPVNALTIECINYQDDIEIQKETSTKMYTPF